MAKKKRPAKKAKRPRRSSKPRTAPAVQAGIISFTVEETARSISTFSGQAVTPEMIREDLAAGAPANSDGTVHLVNYTAWLAREVGNG